METTMTSMTRVSAPRWAAYGSAGSAPRPGVEGTTLSAATRVPATLAPTTAHNSKVVALLPIIDVVVFDGVAGIRSWSPPV